MIAASSQNRLNRFLKEREKKISMKRERKFKVSESVLDHYRNANNAYLIFDTYHFRSIFKANDDRVFVGRTYAQLPTAYYMNIRVIFVHEVNRKEETESIFAHELVERLFVNLRTYFFFFVEK